MNNRHKLPRYISHITLRYIIAAMIGSPFMTACNSSRYGINEETNEQTEMHLSTSDEVKLVDEATDTALPSNLKHGNHKIHLAICNNNLDEVQKLVAENSSVLGEVNAYGNTALHIAAGTGNISTVEWIIKWIQTHPDTRDLVNMPNKNGHSPAHQAGRKNHKEVYDLLVEAGADLTIKCKNHEMTPAEELNHFGQSISN